MEGSITSLRDGGPPEEKAKLERMMAQLAADARKAADAGPPPANAGPPPVKSCRTCGISGGPVKICSLCKSVSYCSVECQKRDWVRGGHKSECIALQTAIANQSSVKNRS